MKPHLHFLAVLTLVCGFQATAFAADDMAADAEFFKMAAMSDMFEIQSSQLAMQKATDPKVKEFATMMVKDHTMASAKVKALATKKGMTLPASLDERHMKMLTELKDDSGKEFDESYMNMQEAAHKQAVALFEKTSKDAKDPEVRALATEILPTLNMHEDMVDKAEPKT